MQFTCDMTHKMRIINVVISKSCETQTLDAVDSVLVNYLVSVTESTNFCPCVSSLNVGTIYHIEIASSTLLPCSDTF